MKWTLKAFHKTGKPIDSCSYGDLWQGEYKAVIEDEIELYGGKVNAVFIENSITRQIDKTMRGLGIGLNPGSNAVVDSAHILRKYG